MSEWSERIRVSPLWRALADLGPSIDNAERLEGIDTPAIEAIARLRIALTFIGKRLAGAEPELLQVGPLENAAASVQSASAEVQQFSASGSLGHLTNANAHIDNALTNIAQLNVPLGLHDLQALSEAADKYRDSLEANAKRVSAAVVGITKDSESLAVRLAELSSEVTTESSCQKVCNRRQAARSFRGGVMAQMPS